MNVFRAVLLDPNNRHSIIESNIGHRVERYTNLNMCVQIIQNTRAECRRIDLFLSVEDYNIIRNSLPLFENIYFHLYCPRVEDIPAIEHSYPYRAYIQVIEEDFLWVKISYAILGYDLTCLTTNYTAQAHQQYEETNRILQEEVKAARLGVQSQ